MANVFFAVLIINIVFSTIFPLSAENEKEHLDIVMRTATAVLAGYFISKNFINKKPFALTDEGKQKRHLFQTNVIGLIGIFSICIMMIIRYPSLYYSSAVLSQIRDLYLGSVAFLMGTANE